MPARSPTVRRRRLAIELRRLREGAGLTVQSAAESLAISAAKLSKIENARVAASQADVLQMLQLYGADAQLRDMLVRIAREARQKGWWQARYGDLPIPELVGLETEATTLRVYSGLMVPGLLQVPEYSRAILRVVPSDLKRQPEEVDRLVELRTARQEILTQEARPAIHVVLDEAALRRPVGGPEVMRRQLKHLTEMAAVPTITLEVLPYTIGEHPGMTGAFTIIGFSDPTDPDVVFIENPMRDLYLEESHEIGRYTLMFEHMHTAALTPAESVTFLAKVAKES